MIKSNSLKYIIYSSIIFVLILVFLRSCSTKDKVQHVLEISGENAKELEATLNHFKTDTLKYKAAEFLIENMPGHYSKATVEMENDNHLQALNLLNAAASAKEHSFLSDTFNGSLWRISKGDTLIRIRNLVGNMRVAKLKEACRDINTIKADWLTNHIQKAFSRWRYGSLYDLEKFKIFSETLLPYRYDIESLNTPNGYPEKIEQRLFSKTEVPDAVTVVRTLSNYFKNIKKLVKQIDYPSNLGFFNILKWNALSCNEQVQLSAKILNNTGLPTYIDTTPSWFNRTSGHSWCTVVDSSGNHHPFSPWWQSIDSANNTSSFQKNYFKRTTKVYRRTYASQKHSAIHFKKKNEVVYPFFNTPFLKDVTDEYHNVASFNILLPDFNSKAENLAYLSVFVGDKWQPIDWGVVKDKKINFRKVPLGFIYAVCSFKNDIVRPLTTPFYLEAENFTRKIEPLGDKKDKLTVFEKFPEKEQFITLREDLINSKFQASNNAKFQYADHLYVFDSMPENFIKEIKVSSQKRYRYVRFIPENGVATNMAIMEYYSLDNDNRELDKGSMPYILKLKDTLLLHKKSNLHKLNGVLISNNPNASLGRLSKGFDGNMESYSKDRWVGIDFGTPKQIDAIRYAARNANNRVNIGDVYRLFYYDGGWIKHSEQKAKYNFLTFTNVPSGTMYWLRNLTKGKEELPFVFYKGKQLFVNYDDLSNVFKDLKRNN